MSDILVSYRQRDSGGWAGRIFNRLGTRFGRDRLHNDLDDATAEIGAAVVVIGPEWLTSLHPDTDTLLTDQGDEVAGELVTILGTGVPVVPLLVDGAVMPAAGDLPPSLRPLAATAPIVVRALGFEDDVARVIDAVDRALGAAPPAAAAAPSPEFARRRVAIAVAVALIGLGLAIFLSLLGDAETGSAPLEFMLRA